MKENQRHHSDSRVDCKGLRVRRLTLLSSTRGRDFLLPDGV